MAHALPAPAFLAAAAAAAALAATPPAPAQERPSARRRAPSEAAEAIAAPAVAAAERLADLAFTPAERELMLPTLRDRAAAWKALRAVPLGNADPPALLFDPRPPGFRMPEGRSAVAPPPLGPVALPEDPEAIAFLPARHLAELVRTRRLTSERLTRLYLDRIKRHAQKLACIVTVTEERALAAARRADEEIAAGRYRGPLHGLPYGLKDLFATKGVRTTWGAPPFKDQVIDDDATVVRRLDAAGAVLVAKTAVGELALGDVWFGGRSRNPWKPERGSSGSSAGSAAGLAAGLFAFAIGTETYGSIVSPATECGVTGLRPTFGRVSRAGAMSLAFSMDKVGPLCRTAEDCALVFAALHGSDGRDPTVIDAPFVYPPPRRLADLRVGYPKEAFPDPSAIVPGRGGPREAVASAHAALETLRRLGARPRPVELPRYPTSQMLVILSAEAAAAFDELTRDGTDDLLVRQERNAWPNVFRAARFVPAVEYLRAQRVRQRLIADMARLFEEIDVLVTRPGGPDLALTNLTGHPAVVVPVGFTSEGLPTTLTFTGRLYGEADVLAVAAAYQTATDYHRRRPRLED
jgi:Asp-tRNA(Asn)/Glu-tRNA(Gln) amidotransferase A subunit family amidase